MPVVTTATHPSITNQRQIASQLISKQMQQKRMAGTWKKANQHWQKLG